MSSSTIGNGATRWGNWGLVGSRETRRFDRGKQIKVSRGSESPPLLLMEEGELLQLRLEVRFFFSFPGLFNFLAPATGMIAIEGFLERDSERGISRVGDDHACPGNGLQQGPVKSD
jgi:hypothetical protein